MGKRPYRNEQTATLANYILENAEKAVAAQDGEGLVNVKEFVKLLDCDCAKEEGIDWVQIGEVFRYETRSLVNSITLQDDPEDEVEETVIEADLPEKTLEVADKIVDEVTDTQESEEDTEDIDKELE